MTNTRSYLPAGDASVALPALPVAAGAEWLATTSVAPPSRRARHLRLVGAVGPEDDAAARPVPVGTWSDGAVPAARSRRRASVVVRRRRLVLGVAASALVLLALPLRATGGASASAAAAPLGGHGPVTYVVRPGDTLWSIAERVDPSADPRPLVARLAAQVGSDTIVPGEQLHLP